MINTSSGKRFPGASVAEVKNYGLSGVHRTLQLGKQGPVLVGNAETDSFTVTLQDAATLTTMGGADATSGTHFITKSQLDSVYTEATFLANVNYNDTSPILLGNISYGTKTIITTFDVTTAFNANAVVTIGDASDNNLLMSDNYAEIEVVGTYQTINTVEFASNSALNIYVTQGGATQGAGTVLVSVVDGPVVNAGAVNYGAGGSNYGNSNVVTLLSSFGSNSISTIGNISANAFVLPGGGTITESTYGFAGSIRLKPIGGSATQYLEIAPTAGGDGDHVHLMAGGGTTELFLGDDNQYVKLASNGAIVVNSANVSLGNSAQWTFGIDGNLTLPGNSFTVNYANGSQVSLGGGGIALANLSVSVNSPSGNGSLTYSNTTGVFTFTPANLSSVAGNYGNSNVVTLLSSLGSNTIVTTGNISAGNVIAIGTTSTGIAAITAGVTNTLLPNTVASFSANVNNYTQVTLQNKSSGADATADFVITANNGSDTVNFADFGVINSGYDNTTPTNSLGNIVFAADTYLYAQGNTSNTSQPGGNLAIGTTTIGKTVKVFAGGANSNSIVGTFSNTGLAVNGNVTANNFIGNISITGNVTGTSQNVSLVAGSFTATFDNTGILTLPRMGGDEGGEINFGVPASNTTLSTRVVLDVYQDRLRIFDGSTKGAYIDLSQAGTGVSTLLNNRVAAFVNAGTFVTMDLIKATVTSSGNRGLSLATTTGTLTYNIGGTYGFASSATSGGSAASSQSLTTTPTASMFAWSFPGTGDMSTYILTDTTNSRAYRITLMMGASFNNNMISIERLI
jgi:hypothetical protein